MKLLITISFIICICICGCNNDVQQGKNDSELVSAAKKVGYNECEIKWRNWALSRQDSSLIILNSLNQKLKLLNDYNAKGWLVANAFAEVQKLYLKLPPQ